MIHPEFGVYCQADLDMGDSGNRSGAMGVYLAESGKNQEYTLLLKNCERWLHTPQGYVRGGIWNDPLDYSRDQASRLMLFYSYSIEGQKLLREYYSGVLKRSGCHQNGDLIGIGELFFLLRVKRIETVLDYILFPFIYLVLCIGDIRFVIDYFICNYNQKARWDMATLCVPDLVHALGKRPTPLLWIARKLFTSKSSTVEMDMKANHSPEKNGCIELIEATTFFFKRLRGEL
jgi:hypothetical protein